MTLEVFWRLPVHGDGRAIRAEQWNRGDYSPQRRHPHPYARTGVRRDGYTYYDHLSQIVRAAELTGFDGAWIPQSPAGEEPLVVAGALAREARRLTFVASLRAPLISAVYAAKIAVSFQRLSGGRLAWNLVTEDAQERPWYGRTFSPIEQIARASEFLDVVRGFWNDAPFTYRGRYNEVENGGFALPLQGERLPRVYLSGASPEAGALSARQADVYVLPLAPVEVLRAQIAQLDALAASHGRTLRYAVEADVVARHSDDEAWSDVHRRWEQASQKTVPISVSVEQTEPLRSVEDLVAGKNLWSGFGLVRPGPATGLVGGYVELADRLDEYARAGVATFVLSANPHLEEAYRIGEQLLPRVRGQVSESTREAV